MFNVTYFVPVCKVWLGKDFTIIVDEVPQCAGCGAMHSLEFKCVELIGAWDINIPEDWVFGQWDRAVLCPVEVRLPVYRCTTCNASVRLKPSFLLKGTRLTLEAVAFVTFAKEAAGLTWRALPELLCAGGDKCAHSTLYCAVHKVGKLLAAEVEELFARYCSSPVSSHPLMLQHPTSGNGFSAPTARFRHTLEREMGARHLVAGLLPEGRFGPGTASPLFYRHVVGWSQVWSKWKRPLPRLYSQAVLKSTKIVA